MPGNKSNNTKAALLVIDAATNKQIRIPLNKQGEILKPVVNLRKWILKRMRTAPNKSQVQIDGTITYYAYPKHGVVGREIQTTIDPATGKETSASMYGAAGDASYGYIAPTSGQKMVKDTLELLGGTFIKHLFTTADLKTPGFNNLVALFIENWLEDEAEDILMKLKTDYIASFGTIGKWASDAGYSLPTSGDGLRVRSEDFTDGQAIIDAIQKILAYKAKLGLKDGPEPTYPFARGMSLQKSTLITLSAEANKAICAEVEKSQNGFLTGVGVDKKTGIVKSINYLSTAVPVDILDDIPAKNGKKVNFMIEEVGKHGAIAMPNVFKANTGILRKHYEGNSLLGRILEGIGISQAFKAFQPELNFISIATASTGPAPGVDNFDAATFKGNVMSLSGAQRKELKTLLAVAQSTSNVKLQTLIDNR